MHVILTMPLHNIHREDTFIWEPGSQNRFSVKSAYQLYRASSRANETQPSSSSYSTQVFKRMWKLNIPEKVKHFLWKGLRDSLPIIDNLIKRKMTIEPICLLCGQANESTSHIFNTCNISKEICRKVTLEDEVGGGKDLWYKRNLKLQGEPYRSPREIKSFAKGFLINHQTAPTQLEDISTRIL
ncbi:hypothetical protein LIER_42693 [Lithospermum erythrorhizon]|uniref:Reverse transcriptase zinc-binding domain-containing protein n=1 Tax=Lithospermum erythrorhizon TaxID=34254 RepID=A0AAV3NU60_LITER